MSTQLNITANEITGGFCNLGPEAPAEEEFSKAKALLQSMHSGGRKHHDVIETDSKSCSLYEHMVSLVKYVLEYQPSHALDQFETLSRLIKRERGAGAGGSQMGAGIVEEELDAKALVQEPDAPEYIVAQAERTLLQHPLHVWDQPPKLGDPLLPDFGGNFEDEEEEATLPNLTNHALLIEQAGIGLGREELMRIWLALRRLYKQLPNITSLRFWGKIYGTQKNYYIAESEFEGDADEDEEVPAPWDKWHFPRPKRVPKEQDAEAFQAELLEDETPVELPVEKRVLIDLPKNKWKPTTPYPWEPRGRGMNRWNFYICNELGDGKWSRLPIVKPIHISMAKHNVRILTGDPNAPIGHLPGGLGLFPGVEAHYLRAQIARIGASCSVSPAGIYEVDEEDEVEEGEKPESLLLAEEYEPLEFTELLDLANWVHHRPFLFDQGRINWITQKKATEAYKLLMAEEETEEGDEAAGDKEDDEEEMAEETEEEEEEPEEGPDLLTPLEEDLPIRPLADMGLSKNGSPGEYLAPSWRVRPSTVLFPANCAVAVVSSNIWPGAYAMARKETFVNVYVGWGNKFLSANYMPGRSGQLSKEFDDEAVALYETVDPTPLQEEEVRLAKEARRLAAEAKEEGEEDEGEGEEEDED